MIPYKTALILCLPIICIFTQCKKEKEITVNAHFYYLDTTYKAPARLFLNNIEKGFLPKCAIRPECNQAEFALSFKLKSGKYTLEVRDTLEQVLSASSFTFYENSMSSSSGKGYGEASLSSDCLLVGSGPEVNTDSK